MWEGSWVNVLYEGKFGWSLALRNTQKERQALEKRARGKAHVNGEQEKNY